MAIEAFSGSVMQREELLAQYLHENNLRDFDWSRWNCCDFVAGWVRRATGFNPLDGVPKVHSKLTAHRLLGQFGGLAGAWTKQMGTDPILPTLAQSGDVVMVEWGEVEVVGICTGRLAAVLTEDQGVGYVSMTEARAAWRVPCGH